MRFINFFLKKKLTPLYSTLFFLLFMPTYASPSSTFFNIKKENFIVVLDAGHGGYDSGAIGIQGKEKDIVLAVTLLTGKTILEQHPDVKVVYTRNKDTFVNLWQRTEMANNLNANLFISIHANASHNSMAKGSEIYTFGISKTQENLAVAKRENSVIYLEDNYRENYEGFDPKMSESYIIFEFIQNKFFEQSLKFASIIQNELKSCVAWTDRGIKQAEYLVLKKTSMPRILVELDFITNPDAEQFLLSKTGQNQYAKSISNAFTKYKNIYNFKKVLCEKDTQDTIENNNEKLNNTNSIALENNVTVTVTNTINTNRLYKIQILSLLTPLEENAKELKGYSANCYKEDNFYKYTYSESYSLKEISDIHKKILKDFKDAFIICFENGKKVVRQ